ncbi:endo-beta-N-acetylglucosaminidase [Enterococcus sp. DIV0876]|uniref:endo-beta-N-acetylglucosaminidase n=1 Tax=Enterococcus sp. DIV0876 TaxID=2774633 RepID=UPI003D300206
MKSSVKKVGAAILLLAASAQLAGCNQSEAETAETKYKETAKSTIEKAMDNQPESSYWFPEDLLAWSFADDPDAKYNTSVVPLAERVDKDSLPQMNDTQHAETKVVALSIMNSSTSGNAPRGINTFDANVFSYWQYIDQLVYWGGSSGEGIIVPPSPDVTDAAHKNGVPVLGTVFFPQTAHGGKLEWLDTFLEKDDQGKFPIVDKLIEVAETYGFDGWFFNQETDTVVTSFDEASDGSTQDTSAEDGLNEAHAKAMQELIAQFKEQAKDSLDIMWYDSMTTDGKMDWQNALTDENKDYLVNADMEPLSDSMFLNFWWTSDRLADQELLKASNEKAKEIGFDPYNLLAGIDVQENGYSTPVRWDLFTDDQGIPYTSLGLYVPSWTYTSSSTPDDFQAKENAFWVNTSGDPRESQLPEDTEWPGISTYALEQTAITSSPFVTNFNLGNGYNYFIEGEKVSSRNWNNRSLQDILPTYRWVFDHEEGNQLTVSVNYADAYNGGNALKLRGQMTEGATSQMALYHAQINLDAATKITTTAKATDKTALSVVLTFKDGSQEIVTGDQEVGTDWTTISYDVKEFADKTVTDIGLAIRSDATNDVYEMNLGQLTIGDHQESQMGVDNLQVEDVLFDEEEGNYAGVRFTWEATTDEASFYELYQINEDGSRSFLGATPSENFYLNALDRQDTDTTVFAVLPVDQYGKRGALSDTVEITWPDNQVPKASFTASKTLAAPGETITFTNTSSSNTEEVSWSFEGGNIESSTDDNPQVTFDQAGTYTVTLTAKNASGETPLEMTDLITIREDAPKELTLLSEGAAVSASSFVNDAEAPEFAVDGDTSTKWCATGNGPHELTIDLGSVQIVSEVHIAHAEAGGESPDMNSRAYTILVSEDGKTFEAVSRTLTNESAETNNTFAAKEVRYVKLSIDKPTQGADSAARIYEAQVYGMERE